MGCDSSGFNPNPTPLSLPSLCVSTNTGSLDDTSAVLMAARGLKRTRGVKRISKQPKDMLVPEFLGTQGKTLKMKNKLVCGWVKIMMAVSSLARGFGENVLPFVPRLRFFVCLFVCLEVETSSRTLIPLFVPGSVYSGSSS